MAVRSKKTGDVRRQAMPVATSISWKPLRDSHYVVASLQPGGGGLRQVFARQSALHEMHWLVRMDPNRLVIGLLLGERLECTVTSKPYMVIDSHLEVSLATLEEAVLADAIQALRSHAKLGAAEVLGWYCRGLSAGAVVTQTIATLHRSSFTEPWQPVLVFGDSGVDGAFFLYDASEARWYHSPFYEITDAGQPSKSTCLAWPAYVTTPSVEQQADRPLRLSLTPVEALAAIAPEPPKRRFGFGRPVVTTHRTPVRDAMNEVGRAMRRATDSLVRLAEERAAQAAEREAQAAQARARAEQRQIELAAKRRAAREEAELRAAETERRRAIEAEERRVAEAEARRLAAEEAKSRRIAEDEARRVAQMEVERVRAAQADLKRQAGEAEAEAKRQVAEAEAEAKRQAAEAEARHQAEAAEAEAKRQADARRIAEAEAQRKAAEEARRIALAEEQRREEERERERLVAEAEARRLTAEAEAEARRRAIEAAAEARRKADEAEALRISLEVAALRDRLVGPPIEGSRSRAPRLADVRAADQEDTTGAEDPYDYLALAKREGFEVAEKIDRGPWERSETVWLLHERESGLRLVVVTTDHAVREASLHYNLHTNDDSILEATAPEKRDLESRTIYGREACLQHLRARCRQLRATGALERDWKVSPSMSE